MAVMKFDPDTARQIMLVLEASDEFMHFQPIEVEGVDPELVSYHIKILADAGLVEATDVSNFGAWEWRAKSLTYAGHQFLDSARDESNWQEAKKTILQRGGAMTIDVLQRLLLMIVERKVFGSTGQ